MTIEIIHLKQFHRIPGIPEYDKQNNICNIVVKSQLNLAKYLERNNDIPVVSESLYDNINCENSSEMCAVTKQYIFPNGLPDSFEQLTHVQKAMLYEYGAAITLTYAGVLPKTYPSIDKDNSDKIDNDFSKGIYNDIFSTREKFAIENAKLAAQDYYDDSTQGKVFIIFGGAHDFSKECDEFGYKISEIDFSLRDEVGLAYPDSMEVSHIEDQQSSSIFSEQLKILSTNHPYRTNQLIQSKHVNIKELSAFAENHFEVLQDVIKRGGLIDIIATGSLHLGQLLEVFYDKEHMQHLWGVV
ncbi:MAG: hypothetical protein N4A31_02540 [Rickettsiales bacterium]|nr:hypothetical protein [Rickettsiales bacterium]